MFLGGQKVLTVPPNMVTVNKNPPNKQTIVITKAQGAGRPPTQQIIVVTTASSLRSVQGITTSQAGQGMLLKLSGNLSRFNKQQLVFYFCAIFYF